MNQGFKSIVVHSTKGDQVCQEDHVVVNQKRGIMVVADGFGGPVPGSEVAKIACDAVLEFLERQAGDQDATLPFVLRSYFSLAGNVLFNALIYANDKVLKYNDGKNIYQRGGASITAAFRDGDLVALAQVGSCRAYLARENSFVPLVTPKDYRYLLEPRPELNQNMAPIPLMALGMSPDLEPEVAEYRVRPGDWLMLESSGFNASFHQQFLQFRNNLDTQEPKPDQVLDTLKQSQSTFNSSISLAIC